MKDNPKDLSLFKHIFDASLEGILVVDEDGKIIKSNSAVEAMFGYGKGELLNEKIELLLPKELREIHQKQRMDFSKAPRTRLMDQALDLWGQKKDGTEFPLRISLSPIMFNDESVTIAYVKDTIDLKKGQYALKAKEAKNKALLDALPDIMVIQNFAGDIVDFYAPENTIAQVPKEEVIGKNIKQIVPPEISKKILKAHNQAIETQKIQIREYTLDINGKKTDFESRTVPLNNHKLLTIVRDITEKKSTERELKESEVFSFSIFNFSFFIFNFSFSIIIFSIFNFTFSIFNFSIFNFSFFNFNFSFSIFNFSFFIFNFSFSIFNFFFSTFLNLFPSLYHSSFISFLPNSPFISPSLYQSKLFKTLQL